MRHVFARLASFLVVAAALLLSPFSPAHAGKANDTLVWATDRDHPIADPNFINTRESTIMGHYAWDTLVYNDPWSGEIKPLLATSWKWVSDKAIEFDLRQDVKFHDGSPMTADDVVYTLNFIGNKDNAIVNYALVSFIDNAEKLDAHKVRLNLKRPFAPALASLAGVAFIYKKGHYDNAPAKADGKKDFGAVKVMGTGPYMITEVKSGEHILAVRNPHYFKGGYKGEAKIGTIRFRTIKDENIRLGELLTGAVDWIWDVPKDQADRLGSQPALTIENAKTLRVSYIQFDVKGASGQKFFMDKRVRQAVAHAINREAIARNMVGPASTVINAACHPDQWGCESDAPAYEYNPDKAKKLLAEAGFPNGFEVDLYGYRERPFTEAVIGDLAKIGIRTKLTWLQYTALVNTVHQGKTPINHMTWGSSSIPDVSACASQFFTGGPDDLAKDAEVIRMIGEADSVSEPAKRKALWKAALNRISTEAYWVPLFTYAKYYAYSKGLSFKPSSDETPQFFAASWK